MGTSILDFWQGDVWRILTLLVATVALVAGSHSVWVMVTRHWWMPRRLGHIMKQQGWKGPPFRLGVGSVPEVEEFVNKQGSSPLAIRNFDTVPTIIPQYALFSKRYGDKCFYYQGSELRILVTNPNLVKEIISKPFQYGKFDVKTMKIKEVIGQFSLPTINGEEWVLHRQLLDPAFHMESIKGMVNTMMNCTASLLQTWEQKIPSNYKQYKDC